MTPPPYEVETMLRVFSMIEPLTIGARARLILWLMFVATNVPLDAEADYVRALRDAATEP